MSTAAADRLRIGKLRYPHSERLHSFRCVDLRLRPGEPCITQGRDGGERFAEVRTIPGPLPIDAACVGCMPRVVRRAAPEDLEEQEAGKRLERIAEQFCREKIASRNLDMRLLYTEKVFGQRRLIFHFLAEQRVDFRELVKDMAHAYSMRIEMRQDGVRDYAATTGGLGPCGKSLCCATHLERFAPVAIKMAKQQGMPLSPNSITGMCGRLKCCLRYEYDSSQPTRRRRGRPADPNPGQPPQSFDA